MKSTSAKGMGPSGMTLLELTIVITVLLLFLGMTYIGVRAWKRGRTDPPA